VNKNDPIHVKGWSDPFDSDEEHHEVLEGYFVVEVVCNNTFTLKKIKYKPKSEVVCNNTFTLKKIKYKPKSEVV